MPRSSLRPSSTALSTRGVHRRRSLRRRGPARPDPRLHLLIESAVDHAVFLLDADGSVYDWNEGGSRLFGYAAGEIVGRPIGCLSVPEEQAEKLLEHFVAEAERCGSATSTGWCRRRDGTRFPARLQFHTERDGAGDVLCFACVVRDLTAPRELEHLRTHADGDTERLPTTDEQAAEFLSTVSHEIRTPLTGIKGFTEALALQDLSPLQRRYVELAGASCQALMTIVDDLLDFSKLDAGKLELRQEPFAVAALAHNALSMILGVASPKGLSLSFTVAPDVPPSLVGDHDRLRQVLLNLLANAVKFTLRGSIRLDIGTVVAADGGARIRFAVVDTGIGIPDDRVPRLFARFSQADATIRGRFGGIGLGLAICKQLIERMGGEVAVETTLGVGSTFWFTVPLPRAPAVAVATATRAPEAAPARDIRLLVVDDGRMNQEIARIFLQHAGYAVDVVDSGTAAIEAVAATTYRAVLMDVQMPDMDGLETTRRIRAFGGAFARLPIIALSARVFSDDVAECLAAGMDDHLGKPFDRAEMIATIERWTTRPE
jgi:PAS domain S-box-containing protein